MEKAIGPEGKMKLAWDGGKLVLSVSYSGHQVGADLAVHVDPDQFVDMLGDLIPGDSQFERTSLAALKVAIKSIKV